MTSTKICTAAENDFNGRNLWRGPFLGAAINNV